MTPLRIPCPQCGQELKIRDRKLLGRRGKCPRCAHTFVLEEPAAVELELADDPPPMMGTGARYVPDPPVFANLETAPTTPSPPIARGNSSPAVAPMVLNSEEAASFPPINSLRRRNPRRQWLGIIAGVAALCVVGGVSFALISSPTSRSTASSSKVRKADAEATPAGAIHASVAAAPTQGEPLPLEMIPSGAQVWIHLRPADLWQEGSPGQELRYCLGPLGTFLEQQIQTNCKFPPTDIEEVLFALIANQRGTAPSLATVVRLKKEAKKSELLERLGGEPVDTFGRLVYLSPETASIIRDLKTFAVAPAKDAEDMVNSIGGKAAFSTGIEEIMAKTDRQRHVTIAFEPTAVLLDLDFLAPPNARPLLREAMDWFGDDAETVAWSLHLESDRFYSDLLVRNKSGIRPAKLAERLQEKLAELPKLVLGAVQAMHPAERGKQKLIGRLPAMMKVVAMATVASQGSRHVELITPLPDRAAPNLALATLLAWDESTRIDVNRSPTHPPSSGTATRTSVAERLKKKIDVDFRRTPLQEAFAFIGEETKVTIDIDGDALKLAGYTKNMPQEFKLDQISGLGAIATIFAYRDQKKMCLVIEEQKNRALITTLAAAEQKGLTPTPATP